MKGRGEDTLSLLVRRARAQREADGEWMLLFEELAHYFYTERKGFITEYDEGADLNDDLWNSEPEQARAKMAEALVAAMCPKDREWPGIKPSNVALRSIPRVKRWCEAVAKIMYAVIYDPRANFTEKMAEIADDTSTFGTAVVCMVHNKREKHMEMCVEHLKNFSFETDGNGVITAQYCWKYWPISTMVREFTLEKLPKELQDEWKDPQGNPEKLHEILHIVMPNEMYKRYGLGPNRLPFKSIWVMPKHCEAALDDTGGYYVSPYVVPRWYRRSKEAWGRSPAMRALPDARLAQSVSAALLEITEKQGNPPMQGPIDILRGEIELFPGGFTAFDLAGFQFQGDPLRPVAIGANPAMTAEYLAVLERKINKHFHGDVLGAPEQDGKSTQDDAAAWQMRMAMRLGPIFSRVENELLPPILDWLFDTLLRTRTLPPIPEELVGERLEYHFDNYVADMRDMAEAQRSINGLAITAQFERPEMEENLDWDATLRDVWSKLKIPDFYVRPREQVEEARAQREQMQQAAQMAEIAKAAGPGLKAGVDAANAAQGGSALVPNQESAA